MAPAKHEKRDISIAYKAIALHRDLTGDFKSVGAGIMDHLNPSTGRCDPSLDRLARMLDMSEKNVRRATARLCELGLFTKKSHGGKAGCASYAPVWSEFRVVVSDWQARMKTGSPPENDDENRTEMSGSEPETEDGEPDNSVPTTGQSGPVEPDRNVRQTKPRNQTNNQRASNEGFEGDAARDVGQQNSEQMSHGLRNENAEAPKAKKPRSNEQAATAGCSRSEAARQAAQRRLNAAIGCEGDEWRRALWLLEPEDMDAAVGAEIDRRGAGIALLRLRMLAAKMRFDAGEAARAS